jgi:hypothetical protein
MFRNFFKGDIYIGNLNYILEKYDINHEDLRIYLNKYNSYIMPLSLLCTNTDLYIDNKFTPLMHISSTT